MGKCCSKPQEEGVGVLPTPHKKQNKDIDDKKMFKIGLDIMGRDLSAQIGYNRRAKKIYTDVQPTPTQQQQNS